MEQQKKTSLSYQLTEGSKQFASYATVLLILLIIASLGEVIYNAIAHQSTASKTLLVFSSLINTLFFWLKYVFLFWLIFTGVYILKPGIAKWVILPIFTLVVVVQVILIRYFYQTLIPLGSDFLGYSQEEISQTVGSSGALSFLSILFVLIIIALIVVALLKLPAKIKTGKYLAYVLPTLSALILISGAAAALPSFDLKSDFDNNLATQKSDYFYAEVYKHYYPNNTEIDIYDDNYLGLNNESSGDQDLVTFSYIDKNKYPFLHADSSENVLSPFFNKSTTPPNIVIVLVEGLGASFSNKNGQLRSFTPYLNSLASESLFFPNFLSSGGRTFAVLPSVLGSLPFAENGFLEMGGQAPASVSLINIVKNSGYHTSFYYGGSSSFDKMNLFLKNSGIDELNDINSFPKGYKKLPAQNGFTWGYGDDELYRWYFESRKPKANPQLSVLLTVSSHSPFLLNEQDKYLKLFESHLNTLDLNEQEKTQYRAYNYQYASILYTDAAIGKFIEQYKKRPDFANTIFLITGDHRMPEIPMSTKIDRYHVPLLIYSPMLKQTARIQSISTHFDIAPSLLAYLHQDYGIKRPSVSAFIGSGIDTARVFRNIHSFPLMQTKTELNDFVLGTYHLNNQTVYRIANTMDEEPVDDEAVARRLKQAFNEFKSKNKKFIQNKGLIPDSVHHYIKH